MRSGVPSVDRIVSPGGAGGVPVTAGARVGSGNTAGPRNRSRAGPWVGEGIPGCYQAAISRYAVRKSSICGRIASSSCGA